MTRDRKTPLPPRRADEKTTKVARLTTDIDDEEITLIRILVRPNEVDPNSMTH